MLDFAQSAAEDEWNVIIYTSIWLWILVQINIMTWWLCYMTSQRITNAIWINSLKTINVWTKFLQPCNPSFSFWDISIWIKILDWQVIPEGKMGQREVLFNFTPPKCIALCKKNTLNSLSVQITSFKVVNPSWPSCFSFNNASSLFLKYPPLF